MEPMRFPLDILDKQVVSMWWVGLNHIIAMLLRPWRDPRGASKAYPTTVGNRAGHYPASLFNLTSIGATGA
jgi:hypothetical protein